jgi:hypothetical protein
MVFHRKQFPVLIMYSQILIPQKQRNQKKKKKRKWTLLTPIPLTQRQKKKNNNAMKFEAFKYHTGKIFLLDWLAYSSLQLRCPALWKQATQTKPSWAAREALCPVKNPSASYRGTAVPCACSRKTWQLIHRPITASGNDLIPLWEY